MTDLVKEARDLLARATPEPWVVEYPTPAEEDGGPPLGHPDCRASFCIRKGSALRNEHGEASSSYYTQDLWVIQGGCFPEDIADRFKADAELVAFAKNHLGDILDRLERVEGALREAWLYVPEHHIPVQHRIREALNGGDQ